MIIDYLQEFWFGERYYTDTSWHKDYFTVELPKVNIDAQIWLAILSVGLKLDEGVLGGAAAGVKSYRFVDTDGITRFRELDQWQGHLWVDNCVEITFAFHVRLAWAKAEGMIYWHH